MFKFMLGKKTFILDRRNNVNFTPQQFLLDFSGSMAEYFDQLKEIALAAVHNGAEVVIFADSAKRLPEDVTLQTWPTDYGCTTNCAAGFAELAKEVTPDTNIVFIHDGQPNDGNPWKEALLPLHHLLESKVNGGRLKVYYMGEQPHEEHFEIMKKMAFRAEPEVFEASALELDKTLYKTMVDNVPRDAHGSIVSTGIWNVVEEFKENMDHLSDLSTCSQPEIVLAALSAILNYMAMKNVEMTYQDGIKLNKLLALHSKRPGVTELICAVREYAASSGMKGVSMASTTLLAMAGVATGRVPDQSLIHMALRVMLKTPDPAYRKQARDQREQQKANCKLRSRFGQSAKDMEPVLNSVAKSTVQFLQDGVMCYQLRVEVNLCDESPSATAVIQNPACLGVTCDGVERPYALGVHGLLPVQPVDLDYIKALLFGLTGGTLYTMQLRFCLLNCVWYNDSMFKPIIRALRMFPGLMEPPSSVKPRAFMHDPTKLSASHFFFYPALMKMDDLALPLPSALLLEALIQGVIPILRQACEPLPLDLARLQPLDPVDGSAVVRELNSNTIVPTVCKKYLPNVQMSLEFSDGQPLEIATAALKSYQVGQIPPRGVSPALPPKEQFLAGLQAILVFVSADPNITYQKVIAHAALRISVAADVKFNASATEVHNMDIGIQEDRLLFQPSHGTACAVLRGLIEPNFIAQGLLGEILDFQTLRILESDLVHKYFKLCRGKQDTQKVLDLIDWRTHSPEKDWGGEALELAADTPIPSIFIGIASKIANLTGRFNGSQLLPKEIAEILMTVEDCKVTGNIDKPEVLAHMVFQPREMRNGLYLLADPNDGLKLLNSTPLAVPSSDEFTIGRKLNRLGVDVSKFGNFPEKGNVLDQIETVWRKQFFGEGKDKYPVENEKTLLAFFSKRHPTGFRDGMEALEFYNLRMQRYRGQEKQVRALRHTEVFGNMLKKKMSAPPPPPEPDFEGF